MAEEKKKEIKDESIKPEDTKNQVPVENDREKAPLEKDEPWEKNENKSGAAPPPVKDVDLSNNGLTTDRFVDFDVWEATLEANFGKDFEKVLSRELGPDWVTKLNSRMVSSGNFYRIIEELKDEVQGRPQEVVDEGHMSFETLGPGEVIFDPSAVGVGGGGGSGGKYNKGIPNLVDMTRKEFEARDLEVAEQPILEKLINDDEGALNEEMVLLDRSDYSRLSYFAHKELERHKDDPKIREIIQRKSQAEEKKKTDKLNLFLAISSSLIVIYILFSVICYFICSYYSRNFLVSMPPDLAFNPSTEWHKQGELSRIIRGEKNTVELPLIFYFLSPGLKKLEIRHIQSARNEEYKLAELRSTLLVVPDGPGGDSIVVRENYHRYLPTNLGVFSSNPYLSLYENNRIVLSARETVWSSLLPGVLCLKVIDSQGFPLAAAYKIESRLYIQVSGLANLNNEELDLLSTRLIFLFSLLSF